MSDNKSSENAQALAKIVAQAWADEAFKKQLLADPATVFKQHGVHLPAGMTPKVHEDNDTTINFVLPPSPTDLSDEDLENVAGGVSGPCSTHPTRYAAGPCALTKLA